MDLPELTPSEDLIAALASLEAESTGWLEISAGLRRRDEGLGDLQAGWLMTAFDYPLARRVGTDSRNGRAFSYAIVTDSWSYPLPVSEVPDEVIALWDAVAERSSGWAVLARLHHLLFERQHGNAGVHAREAIRAYLEIGIGPWPRIERVNCLHWSLDLSRRINDHASAEAVILPLIAIARESLTQEQAEPGISLHAIEILAMDDPANTELPELLSEARRVYLDPFMTTETIRIQQLVSRGDEVRREKLHRSRRT